MTLDQDILREWVRKHLAESGRTQAELAAAWGYDSPDRVNKFLAGTRKMGIDELFATVRFIGAVPPAWFTGAPRELTYVPVEEEVENERAALTRERRYGTPRGEIPQIDGTIGLGNRSDVATVNIDIGNGHAISGAPVLGNWAIPAEVLQRRVRTTTSHLHFIECEGNSMYPLIKDGDVVLIDQTKRSPNMPGIFALWEDGGQTIKQVEVVRDSEPRRLRLIPANKEYSTYEVLADDVVIIGRYVARFTVD
ncbi:LexA family transcriptional regulator [Aquamicrobium soli]|uniref:S24 family peptidase n=1 Tax=Aquamicrobium soli TaxID=1811518 RepID=A0ABV7K919_9HYPH